MFVCFCLFVPCFSLIPLAHGIVQSLLEAQEGLKLYRTSLGDLQERFPYHRASIFFSYGKDFLYPFLFNVTYVPN
jgi:hypothetical protein